MQARNELLIADTIREARRGAQIVPWPKRIAAVPDGIHDSAFQKPDEVSRLIRIFLG